MEYSENIHIMLNGKWNVPLTFVFYRIPKKFLKTFKINHFEHSEITFSLFNGNVLKKFRTCFVSSEGNHSIQLKKHPRMYLCSL